MLRQFSKRVESVKVVNPISKLQHVKLDLSRILAPNMVPLIRQNIINRQANYANVDLVLKLYEQYRTLLFEVD